MENRLLVTKVVVGLFALSSMGRAQEWTATGDAQDGVWAGTTGQSRTYELKTQANKIVEFKIGYGLTGCSGTTTIAVTGGVAITSNSFTWTTTSFCAGVGRITTGGTFDPVARTASGTLSMSATPVPFVCGCSGSLTTTWSALLPAGVPGAPAIGAANAGDGSVSVNFSPPADTGGAAITSYTATCGTRSATGTASPITVTGLTNGTAVTCNVLATNSAGNGPPSAASNSVTPAVGTAITRLVNISTRGRVETGDNIMIGGFITGGSSAKRVVITGRGPSLAQHGVQNTLADPTIRLFAGATEIGTNDNWQSAANASEVTASGFAPTNASEAAILTTVNPNVPYTVHLSGVSGTAGIAIVEVFEASQPELPLLNISTRGRVQTGDDVMIGGFIIQGNVSQQVLVTARGPALGLAPFNLAGVLADPTLELFQAGNSSPIATNDNWGESTDATAISATGNAPTNSLEAAILRTLAPGAYTAIVRGKGGGIGIGIVEVFRK